MTKEGDEMGRDPWKVLIVDDEPPIRSELRYLLEGDPRVGAVSEAGNVAEATERVLVDRPSWRPRSRTSKTRPPWCS